MGSGAFLVAACRFLARRTKAALVEDGQCLDGGHQPAESRGGRLVAQRCLFGVDLNPMAVQLARLSLWLTTLAADRPLTFLDHHLSPATACSAHRRRTSRSRPAEAGARTRGSSRSSTTRSLTEAAAGVRVRARSHVEQTLDDSAAIVRQKERALAELAATGALQSWKAMADLWCAAWFLKGAMPTGVFNALVEQVLTGRCCAFGRDSRPPSRRRSPDRQRAPLLSLAAGVSRGVLRGRRKRASGRRLRCRARQPALGDASHRTWGRGPGTNGVRERPSCASRGTPASITRSRTAMRTSTRCSSSGPSGWPGQGDASRSWCRQDSCMTMGARRCDTCCSDSPGWNRSSASTIAPASSPFIAACASSCSRPRAAARRRGCAAGSACRIPRRSIGSAKRGLIGDQDDRSSSHRHCWSSCPAPGLAIPDVRSRLALAILEKVGGDHPPLSSAAGWHARFGRELNASDDKKHFTTGGTGSRSSRGST